MEDREKNIRPIRVVSFLSTCLFLVVAVGMSNGIGTFVSKINTITANLDRAVLSLDTNINYTDYQDNTNYVSKTMFNSKGMGGLYNMTRMFIDVIIRGDALMPGLVTVHDKTGIDINYNIEQILNYYKGLFALILFLLLCIVLFPLSYLFFCCCRCCGNCGARPQPTDKRKDLWKKICQGTVLIILGTGLLFCVVCAFVSNQQLYDGVNDLPQSAKNTIQDTNSFLKSTSGQIRHLLGTNYDEFSHTLIGTLNNSSEIVTKELENYSNATAMLSLQQFANNLGNVNDTLNTLKIDSNKLRVYASQLNDALRKVKKDLLASLKTCEIQECRDFIDKINKLQTNIDFNQLPDLSESIQTFQKLNVDNIRTAIDEGSVNLQNIKNDIKKKLDDGITQASDQITKSGETIKQNMEEITTSFTNLQDKINGTNTYIITLEQNIKPNLDYQYYIGIGISCILLLVTICIALGLICGICGKRPDGYSDNCCNKGTGSQFLICAVTIMFIFGLILAVITLAGALIGIFADKLICTTFRTTRSNTMDLFDKLLDLKSSNIYVTPSELLVKCHQNKSIYVTLNLENQFNISSVKEKFDISSQLDQFNINSSLFANLTILSPDNERAIRNLEDFDPPDLDKFGHELEGNFTNYNLSELSKKLIEIKNLLKERQSYTDIVQSIDLSILHLNTYDEKILTPLKELANTVIEDANNLNILLKMNHSNFKEAVDSLLTDTKNAEEFLKGENGTEKLKTIIENFKNSTMKMVNGYIDRVENHITEKMGLCGPLSNVINSTLVSTCDKIILPLNGFWFSLLWSTILYIITIIVAVKLASLYQKYKPYSHGYVETEYLYDAYADSIPLNSRGGKRDKKKGKKPKRYEERPTNVGHGAVSRGSHPVDGRYDDMAPKHWEDFPNGGPPHYQRAPTEYERPPPYYYPGTGGDQ